MKKIYIHILIFFPFFGMGQNQFYIGSGSTITANSHITLLDADLNNNGVYNGALTMTGNNVSDTFIINNSILNIDILDIEGNNDVNLENGDLNISNAINLNSDAATLLLGSANINLESDAVINHESNIRQILGANGTYIKIQKEHSSSASETFGNIGFQIDLADASMGLTEVYRHYENIFIDGNQTVRRYYEIIPQNSSNINAEVRFYYITPDLNGLQSTSLSLYQSDEENVDWTEFMGSVIDNGIYPYFKPSSVINPINSLALAVSGITLSSTTEVNLSNIDVYPNPTQDLINVNIPNTIKLKKHILIDSNGRTINLNISNDNYINLSKLSEGLYFLNLYTNKGTISKKIIIQK